jgi:hypothetical protein
MTITHRPSPEPLAGMESVSSDPNAHSIGGK